MSNNEIGNSAVYDARELGKGKMFLLGFQHMFAMFGATVLVPLLTGLDVQTTLLMAGLGTILFHIFTKLQVPGISWFIFCIPWWIYNSIRSFW